MRLSRHITPRHLRRASIALAALALLWGSRSQCRADDKPGFESLFDGKTLAGWDGNPKFWHAEDGTITGQTTTDNPTKGNTFLIWRGGEVGDFELKAEYRLFAHNSGIQYRSFEVPDMKWVVGGYQADMEAGDTYSGILYEERARGILAQRGEKTVVGADHKPKVVGSVGDSKKILAQIKKADWNTYEISAHGFHFVQKINGVTTIDCTDEDAQKRRASGVLALQLHAGQPMKVQFKNIRLKRFPSNAAAAETGQHKKVVFIAGKKSHGYAAHEHRAGCLLLAKGLAEGMPNIETKVVTDGWPQDAHVLDDADAIVVYADGGDNHPLMQHLAEFDKLMKKGVGLVCLHYAVEIPKGEPGHHMLQWTGGNFETDWSVNPMWMANYKQLPKHPIAKGVRPFSIYDEWYYHMRFRDEMEGVAPILTAIPPASTLERPDGTHSNNRFVRAEAGKPQHMAWATERPDGGRGFGLSGGHVHWNWGNDDFRKLVLNAIVWTAKADVPTGGVQSRSLTLKDLEANQDEPTPNDFNEARIRKMLEQWQNQSAGG